MRSLVSHVRRAELRSIAALTPEAFPVEAARVANISRDDFEAVSRLVQDMENEIRDAGSPEEWQMLFDSLRARRSDMQFKRAANFGSFGVQASIETIFAVVLVLITGGTGACGILVTCCTKCSALIITLIIALALLMTGPIQTFFLDGTPLGFDPLTPWLQLTAESWNGGLDSFDFNYFASGAVDLVPGQAEALLVSLLRTAMCFVPIPLPPTTCPPELTADEFGQPDIQLGPYLINLFLCDPTLTCSVTSPENFICRCPSTVDPEIWRTATDSDPCVDGFNNPTGTQHCWPYYPRDYGILPSDLNWSGDLNCDSLGYQTSVVNPFFGNPAWYSVIWAYVVDQYVFMKSASRILFNAFTLPVIGTLLSLAVVIPCVGFIGPLIAALTIILSVIAWIVDFTQGPLLSFFNDRSTLPLIGFLFEEAAEWVTATPNFIEEGICMVIVSPVIMINYTVLVVVGQFVAWLLIVAVLSGFLPHLFYWLARVGSAIWRPIYFGYVYVRDRRRQEKIKEQ